VGRGCHIVNSVIEGRPEWPVIIGDHVTLINCHVRSTGEKNAFAFCGWEVDQRHTCLGDGVAFSNARLWNADIEAGSHGFGPLWSRAISVRITTCGLVQHQLYDDGSNVQSGSEVSKTLLMGEGFVSEHGNSYLSLLAPEDYPILTAAGREEVSQ